MAGVHCNEFITGQIAVHLFLSPGSYGLVAHTGNIDTRYPNCDATEIDDPSLFQVGIYKLPTERPYPLTISIA